MVYPLPENYLARFWSKVDTHGNCWEWKSTLNEHGYGLFAIYRKFYKAHRVSWTIANGPISGGLFVLHKCDNPKCVNPEHLFIGTQTDNMHDCSVKGRTRNTPQLGEKNVFAALTGQQVLEIRALAGRLEQREIARMYGVKDAAISKIILRRTWRHI